MGYSTGNEQAVFDAASELEYLMSLGTYKNFDCRICVLRMYGEYVVEIEVDLSVVNEFKSPVGTIIYTEVPSAYTDFEVGDEVTITVDELKEAYDSFEEIHGFEY
jgi:hypothetical protein